MASPSASDGIKFIELNDICFLEILKYLGLKERTRFERVDKRWGQALNIIWLKEKTLFFSKISHFTDERDEALFLCRNPSHAFDDGFHYINKASKSVEKILKKATNIRSATGVRVHQLEKVTDSRLEHLSLPFGSNINETIKGLNGWKPKRLQCFHFSLCEARKDFDYKSLENLLNSCPLLEELSIDLHDDDMKTPLEINLLEASLSPIFPQLKRFRLKLALKHCSKADSLKFYPLLDTLLDFGKSLEAISILGKWYELNPEDEGRVIERILDKCPKLTSVEWTGSKPSIKHFLSSDRVEHVSWHTFDRHKPYLCLGRKENLKTLKIRNILRIEKIEVLPTFFPNLVNLKLDFLLDAEMRNIRIGLFSSLKRLRRLVIMKAKVNDKVVKEMLENCSELREVHFISCFSLSPEIIVYFETYSQLYPKRLVKLYVKRNLDGNERSSPEEVIRKNLRIHFLYFEPTRDLHSE